ncbi:MAG: hypothetical protein KDK70_28695 [Myxococcales bacterium]|nr:hypothetical protein [Myxococcales bacterium]
MELLVYARNYRPLGSYAERPVHRDLGAVVGASTPPISWGERLCSFVEVRLPLTVIDPSTEIELLVAKAFAAWGHPGAGRVLRFCNSRGRVSLLLEPGFERTREVCQALQPVLPEARVLLDRAMAQAAARRAARRGDARPAAPDRVTRPERVVPPRSASVELPRPRLLR